MSDTIAAIATALGESGVAVVRVTGPQAVPLVGSLARTRRPLEDAASHTVHHAWLHGADGTPIDEVLVTVMRGPRTYTGEDLVEVGVHGGTLPARRVLRALLAGGARLADRGEFTKRAFLNGRMNLSQAEAVVDVVRARTERAADAALATLAGKLADRTLAVEGRLLDLLARLEVNLDFNEDVQAVGADEVRGQIEECRAELAELERRAPWGRRLREGASVVLVGRPNVGKSSLFNAFLQDERALVSEAPGTTRDWLEAWLDIGGVPVRLVDTAGLRFAGGALEAEGVRRAARLEEEADLRLVVLDSSEGLRPDDEAVLRRTAPSPRVVVWNKSDLSNGSPEPGLEPGGRSVAVSALTGEGLEGLREEVAGALLSGVGREPADDVIPGERHADAIRRAVGSLRLAGESGEAGRSEELIAVDVRDALAALGEITGKTVGEEVLDRIFSRFCIGK